MLLEGNMMDPTTYLQLISVLVLTVAAQFCWVNYFCTDLLLYERGLFFVAFLALILYIFLGNIILCVIGLTTFVVAVVMHLGRWKKEKRSKVEATV